MSLMKYLVLLLHLIVNINAAKVICVFPVPIRSHQNYFGIAVNALAKTGNNVSVFNSIPDVFNNEVYIQNNVTLINNEHATEIKQTFDNILVDWIGMDRVEQHEAVIYYEGYLFKKVMTTLDRKDLQHNYDLLMLEAIEEELLVLPHKWGIPVMMISSVPPHQYNRFFGYSAHPLYYPEANWAKTDISNFWSKLYQVYYVATEDLAYRYRSCIKNNLIQEYGKHNISLYELRKNVDIMFLNANHFWDGNRPLPPGLVFLENLEHGRTEDIPQNLKTYMDASKNGIIFFSFGTTFNTDTMMSKKLVKIFQKVFSRLNFNVIWKWDADEMDGKPDNVRIEKWLPQKFVLGHHNLKLFITHGGTHSTSEAIELGAPMVVIPLLGDQFYNAERAARHAVGKQLHLTVLNEDSLYEAIKTVIEDPRYRQNSKRLKKLWNDKPHTPVEKFIWWSQYLIRHKGAKHLRSLSKNVTWSEYLVLDLIFSIIVLSFAFMLIFFRFLKNVKRILRSKKKNV